MPAEVGERDCAHLHLEHLPVNSLTLFDRGYPGHWLFALFEKKQRYFLMRLPCGYNAQVKAFLQSGQAEDTQFFAASHPEARLFCTDESEVLLTSLLDRQAFPVEVFACSRTYGNRSRYWCTILGRPLGPPAVHESH